MLSTTVVKTYPDKAVMFPVLGSPPIYTAIVRNSRVLTNTTSTAAAKFYEEGNYTCVATSKYGSEVREFSVVLYGELKYFFDRKIASNRGFCCILFIRVTFMRGYVFVFFQRSSSFFVAETRGVILSQYGPRTWLTGYIYPYTVKADTQEGFCSRGSLRGMLRKQSSSVCTNDFLSVIHSREQNFHPEIFTTTLNRLRSSHTRSYFAVT